MSKYQPLTDYLARLEDDAWAPTFQALETLLGFDLPKGARARSAWWKNAESGHVGAWTAAGWDVADVDLKGEAVSFRRVVVSPAEDAPPPPEPEGRTVHVAGRDVPVKTLAIGAAIAAGAAVLLGAVTALAKGVGRKR